MLGAQPQPGNRYGRLVARRSIEYRTKWRTLWDCDCDCGGRHVVAERDLRSGHIRSCGCLSRQNQQNFIIKVTATKTEQFLELLDVLESVMTRFPTPPREIRAALLDEWGHCDDRRFWRALQTLIRQGRASRCGTARGVHSSYARAIPWPHNLSNCIADAAATYAVYELGMRRAA